MISPVSHSPARNRKRTPYVRPEGRTLSDVCVELVEECLNAVTGPEALLLEDVVHDLRVATKRLRAAWHLAKPAAGKNLVKERKEALRELSACVAESRDAAVLHELANRIASEDHGHPEVAESLGKVAEGFTHPAEEAPPSSALEGPCQTVRKILEGERDAWRSVDFGPNQRRILRGQLRRTLQKSREKTAEAIRDKDPEVWHDWRKAVKRLRYEREFMAEIYPRNLGAYDDRIKRLGTHLGERNDLANLIHRTHKMASLPHQDRKTALTALAKKEKHLMQRCTRLGRRTLLK